MLNPLILLQTCGFCSDFMPKIIVYFVSLQKLYTIIIGLTNTTKQPWTLKSILSVCSLEKCLSSSDINITTLDLTS
jgi:hypothetical protein